MPALDTPRLCKPWCDSPCTELNGNAVYECGSCSISHTCAPGAPGFPADAVAAISDIIPATICEDRCKNIYCWEIKNDGFNVTAICGACASDVRCNPTAPDFAEASRCAACTLEGRSLLDAPAPQHWMDHSLHELYPPADVCGRPSAGCAADTLLYFGSDVDLQPLLWLQPWETRAVLVDTFDTQENDVSAGSLTHELPTYEEVHKLDPRPSYRKTTRALRRLTSHRREVALEQLVAARLLDTGFTVVRSLGNLSFGFVHAGRARTLEVVISDMESMLSPAARQRSRLSGRVSSFVALSFGSVAMRPLMLTMSCLPRVRFIVGSGERAEFVSRLWSTVEPNDSASVPFMQMLPYRGEDAFNAAARAYAICAEPAHSFWHAVNMRQSRDLFSTFVPGHIHQFSRSKRPKWFRDLAIGLANMLWGTRPQADALPALGDDGAPLQHALELDLRVHTSLPCDPTRVGWPRATLRALTALRRTGAHFATAPCLASPGGDQRLLEAARRGWQDAFCLEADR